MEGLSSVFEVLAALFKAPSCEAEYLHTVVETLVDELESSPNSMSFEFAPFVMSLLVDSGRQADVSARAREVLQSYARGAAMQSISRDHVMGQLADRFAQNDVQAVLLKGAAMDSAVYPREAFRLGCDVDFLVPAEDFGRVDDVLTGLAENIEKTPGKLATTAFAIEKTFVVHKPTYVQLDVHREVTVPHVFPIDYDELHARCIEHPAHGGRFRCLSDEDNLLQFAMHSFYDMQMFSKQTIDAYMLIEKDEIDWDALVSRAKSYCVLQPLKILLEGVHQVFDSVPPAELKLSGFRRWLAYRLLTRDRRMSMQPGFGFRLRQLAAQFLLSGNVLGWIRYYFFYVGAKVRDLMG
jgi:hypothetical protein